MGVVVVDNGWPTNLNVRARLSETAVAGTVRGTGSAVCWRRREVAIGWPYTAVRQYHYHVSISMQVAALRTPVRP